MRIGLVASVTLKKISAYSFIVSISMVDSGLFRYRLYSKQKVHQPRSLLLLIVKKVGLLITRYVCCGVRCTIIFPLSLVPPPM